MFKEILSASGVTEEQFQSLVEHLSESAIAYGIDPQSVISKYVPASGETAATGGLDFQSFAKLPKTSFVRALDWYDDSWFTRVAVNQFVGNVLSSSSEDAQTLQRLIQSLWRLVGQEREVELSNPSAFVPKYLVPALRQLVKDIE